MNSYTKPNTGRIWRVIMWGAAASLLMLPLVAMQFTPEVQWTLSDFVLFGVMLSAGCGTVELAARGSGSLAYRLGVGVAVIATFLLIWFNLAVGIIGSEDNPANLMFSAVLAVAVLGAVVVWFDPAGLVRVMIVAALTQIGVGVIAIALGTATTADPIVPLTIFFTVLWLLSAGLFHKASRDRKLN